MKILTEYGRDDLAKVYVAQLRDNNPVENKNRYLVEFVESLQPPLSRENKWVLIISSMFGCPIHCIMCDAGGDFSGCLTAEELLAQVDYMVRRRYPDGKPVTSKFKIQFARMGEPSLNPAVLKVLEQLPIQYDRRTLYVSLSSIAPFMDVSRKFFDKLCILKSRFYPQGRFQLQFSIHTTDEKKRDELIPVKKWSFYDIAAYGKRFCHPGDGDKKITLNFASIVGYPIDVDVVSKYFNPDLFLIKITPMNPTLRSQEASLVSVVDPFNYTTSEYLIERFRKRGYEVILSIGEPEENQIGSNCGQYIQRALAVHQRPKQSYEVERYSLV